MSKIPIISEKVRPSMHKTIEWSLHNVCNYNCSFCGPEHKIGDRRWKSLDTYKMYVDKLLTATGSNPWFIMTGGEPTLFPEFIELMSYLKSKGAYICLISNGSRTLRWWKECKDAKILDLLYITYHPEQTSDYRHIAEVLNLFHDEPTKTNCFITHTNARSSMDLVMESLNFLLENTASKIEIKHMNSPSHYDINVNLTETQIQYIKKSYIGKKLNKTQSDIPLENQYENKIAITHDDGAVEVFSGSQELIKQNKNHFLNWMCNVNNDVLTVENNLCRRGQMDCKISGIVADLDVDEVFFIDEYIKCPYESCYCSGNLYAKKYKSINV